LLSHDGFFYNELDKDTGLAEYNDDIFEEVSDSDSDSSNTSSLSPLFERDDDNNSELKYSSADKHNHALSDSDQNDANTIQLDLTIPFNNITPTKPSVNEGSFDAIIDVYERMCQNAMKSQYHVIDGTENILTSSKIETKVYDSSSVFLESDVFTQTKSIASESVYPANSTSANDPIIDHTLRIDEQQDVASSLLSSTSSPPTKATDTTTMTNKDSDSILSNSENPSNDIFISQIFSQDRVFSYSNVVNESEIDNGRDVSNVQTPETLPNQAAADLILTKQSEIMSNLKEEEKVSDFKSVSLPIGDYDADSNVLKSNEIKSASSDKSEIYVQAAYKEAIITKFMFELISSHGASKPTQILRFHMKRDQQNDRRLVDLYFEIVTLCLNCVVY
jgi:hypothetical protein